MDSPGTLVFVVKVDSIAAPGIVSPNATLKATLSGRLTPLSNPFVIRVHEPGGGVLTKSVVVDWPHGS